MLLAAGNENAALISMKEAIAKAPTRLDFKVRAIRILLDLGRTPEARILAEQGLDLTEQYQFDPELVVQLRELIEEIG